MTNTLEDKIEELKLKKEAKIKKAEKKQIGLKAIRICKFNSYKDINYKGIKNKYEKYINGTYENEFFKIHHKYKYYSKGEWEGFAEITRSTSITYKNKEKYVCEDGEIKLYKSGKWEKELEKIYSQTMQKYKEEEKIKKQKIEENKKIENEKIIAEMKKSFGI